jgi:S1-C subfamily serine protease
MDDNAPVDPPGRPAGRRLGRVRRVLALLLAGGLLAVLAFTMIRSSQPFLTRSEVDTEVARAMASATPRPSQASQVYQKIQPSVVMILRYNSDSGSDKPSGEGTGVIVDQSGLILTALHVVDNASRIQVIFDDGTTSDAMVTNRQPADDIAVILPRQLPSEVVPAVMGDPGTLNVGDEAIVVGNPFGFADSLSNGVISGLNRSFSFTDTNSLTHVGPSSMQNLIQFDAAVNPGNSGGPLLNRDGEVVGIVTSLVNPTKDNFFIGIGFAVPIQAASSALGENPF